MIFYVLEETCEVIAKGDMPLRADWATHILHSTDFNECGKRVPLLHRLKWSHTAEYESGISMLWLRRIECEGEQGKEKRQVAERYVLACVVANGVSGKWRSVVQMAQDFAGLPENSNGKYNHSGTRVQLYLPA